jgi:hypothetical protein
VEGNEMTQAHKITFLAAAILGLSCGGYLARRRAVQNSDSLESMQYIAPTKVASDFARKQFMHADTDHARHAVMLQIRLLEQLELADKSFHANDLVFAYIRLAMVEEAAGQTEAEQRALAQARARIKQTHFRNTVPTDDELENGLRQLDRALDNL